MSATEWADLQDALLYVFAQPVYWMLAFGVALAFLSAVVWIFLSLYAWMTR